MAKGVSLHIGVNKVDQNEYSKYGMMVPSLDGCVPDAKDLCNIAQKQQFDTHLLTNSDATAQAVLDKISDFSSLLEAGDVCVITFAGHGDRVPDQSGDETDNYDETWVLYDRQLIDDELRAKWTLFKEGVRILLISDSCNSGTVAARAAPRQDPITGEYEDYERWPQTWGIDVFGMVNYMRKRQEFYSHKKSSVNSVENIKASVMLMSASRDYETAGESDKGYGKFTNAIKTIWDDGTFTGSHDKFHQDIKKLLRFLPDINWPFGEDQDFLNSRPFSFEPDVQTEEGTPPAVDQNSQPSTPHSDPYEGLNLKPWQKELANAGDGILKMLIRGLSRR